jgi:rhomboid family GlyGly-CTERM serine protease
LATGVVLAAIQAGDGAAVALLQYQRSALQKGEWWRLLTAHCVHLNATHLAFNLAGLVLLWALFARCFTARQWLGIVLCVMLGVDTGLWFASPAVAWYVGASGVLHGVWSAGAWKQWQWPAPLTGLPLAVLLLKLLYEHFVGTSAVISSVPVVLDAHVYGAVAGLILPLIWSLSLASRRRWL